MKIRLNRCLLGVCFSTLSFLSFTALSEAADRSFPSTLPAYTHPRVFCNASELPQIKSRLDDTRYQKVSNWIHAIARSSATTNRSFVELSRLNISSTNVPNAVIEKHFKADEFRSYDWSAGALWSKLYTNGEARHVPGLKDIIIKSAVNYARIYTFTELRYRTNNYSGLSDASRSAIQRYWSRKTTYEIALPFIHQAGGVGLALVYDMLYSDMDNSQRADLRQSISLSTRGWKVFGADQEPVGLNGNAVSNHYGYCGEVAVMLAAIYGETGFDPDAWNQIRRILKNYIKVGFTTNGYCIEDTYGPNLGLREGLRGLIAMARHGDNYFATNRAQMVEIPKYIAYDSEAIPDGDLIGGESGGNTSFPNDGDNGIFYPSSIISLKYIYKDEPLVDYAYRWRLGDDYFRSLRGQSLIEYAYLGGASSNGVNTLEGKGASLIKYYPQRGKTIIRNDFTNTATQLTFDARPDAFNIGHDKAGRGYVNLNALGKRWISHYNFREVRNADESSTVVIDGKGQAYKSPSVKMIGRPADQNGLITAAADLKYAYDWQWSEPWTTSASHPPRPAASDWQQETINPRSFYPSNQHPSWLPTSLWNQPNIGYPGMWMWKRPNQPVQKAFRSICYGKSQFPYIIIADDIKKDNNQHRYDSYFQISNDIDRISVSGNDATLWSSSDPENRRLLVRVLQGETSSGSVSFANETYKTSLTNKDARRLRIRLNAVDPQLKVLLWPHYSNMSKPQTVWNANKTQLTIAGQGITRKVINVQNTGGRSTFSEGSVATPPPVNNLPTLPARIQSEDYTSFNDTDPANRGGKYRNDAVDIESTGDTGGGYNVGWVYTGEWLEYRVNIPTSGRYDLIARVAAKNSDQNKIQWSLNGTNLGTASIPKTNGWQSWRTITIPNVQLNQGNDLKLRTEFIGNGSNFNWIEIRRTSTAPAPSPGTNIAPLATARASSSYNTNYRASNVLDGVTGIPNRGSWASSRERTPWIELEFPTVQNVSGVEIFNRATSEYIQNGKFTYYNSQGNAFSSFQFSGGMPRDGKTGRRWSHPRDGVKKIRFQITSSGGGSNLGLGEFKVFTK